MRPLLLANRGFVLGGGEVGLEILVDGLLERGIPPRVVLPTAGTLLADRAVDRLVTSPQGLLTTLRAAAVGCTVVHTYSVDGFDAAIAAGLDLPIVLHALVPNPHPRDSEIARSADLVICNSHATAQRFGRNARTTVIYNGVRDPIPVAPHVSVADPRLATVVIIGGLSHRKGQLDALPALVDLTERRADIEVVFIGRVGGPLGLVLRQAIENRERIRAVGFVPQAADHMPWCDLVLVPSRSEGFGRMAAEALRAGVPVLARPVEGLIEVLDGLANPWLPPDLAAWSQRIEHELDHPSNTPDELRSFGRRFDVDRFVDDVIAAYHHLSAAPRVSFAHAVDQPGPKAG